MYRSDSSLMGSAPSGIIPGTSALGAVFMAAAAAGCGLGIVGEEERGQVHLPTRGAGPYGKLAADRDTPADEPYLVSEFRVHLRDPAALRRRDGGFRIWFGRVEVGNERAGEIWMTELPGLRALPDVPPGPALVPDQPWEQGWVGAPSVLEMPDGALVMLYQGGIDAPAIGRADSPDQGRTWQKHPGNPVLVDAAGPGAALVPDADDPWDETIASWVMYLTRPGTPGIFRADSPDGLAWTIQPEPVLLPRTHLPQAFDHHAVSDPFVVIRRTASGMLHHGMFFNGVDRSGANSTVSVGWAGSFDGLDWHRLASPDQPVLAPGGVSEHAPAVLLEPDGSFLFFHEGQPGAQRIAVAVHP
jgi:hypothetical protein